MHLKPEHFARPETAPTTAGSETWAEGNTALLLELQDRADPNLRDLEEATDFLDPPVPQAPQVLALGPNQSPLAKQDWGPPEQKKRPAEVADSDPDWHWPEGAELVLKARARTQKASEQNPPRPLGPPEQRQTAAHHSHYSEENYSRGT